MKILVTGGAGFIGSHACEHLLGAGHHIVALDNFDSYYPKARKRRNVETAQKHANYKLIEGDFGDRLEVSKLLEAEKFDVVLHLAAQAGVRPSIHDPLKYERTNVRNLIAMLEAMRDHGPRKIVAASSSSVYGNQTPVPFREDAPCMQMLSPYAASKRAAEVFLGTYTGLYDFKVTVVRPFTVYGPRQRPDMAISSFAEKLLLNEPITLYGDGSSSRDYTYVSDIVDGLAAAVDKIDSAPGFTIYNLGGEAPVSLSDLIAKLEAIVGRKAQIQRMEIPQGDVERTAADISKARKELGFAPKVALQDGLQNTVDWVRRELRLEAGAMKK